MKRQLFRIVLLVIALAMGSWLMSCATGPQNVNQNTGNANTNTITNTLGVAPAVATVCDGLSNINAKVNAVGNDVNASINTDPELKAQRDNNIPNFKYLVGKAGSGSSEHVVLVIEGKVSDGNQPAKLMKNLAHLIQKNVKRGCLLRVWFVKPQTLPLTPERFDFNNIEGFEWSACEWPDIPCPGGICAQSCKKDANEANSTPSPTPKPNENSNRPGNP
jgi:hypothetical protein